MIEQPPAGKTSTMPYEDLLKRLQAVLNQLDIRTTAFQLPYPTPPKTESSFPAFGAELERLVIFAEILNSELTFDEPKG